MAKNKKDAAQAQVESVNTVDAQAQVEEAPKYFSDLQEVVGRRTMKEDKKIDKNILIISRTPKQTVHAMNGIMDICIDAQGYTLRQRLAEAGIVVGNDGLTLKDLYAQWAWKDEQGQLLHLATRTAKVPVEDGADKPVYAFNKKSKKWETFKKYEVARMGVECDFMGKTIVTGWSIAMILDALRQMQHLDEYRTAQTEAVDAWEKVTTVYTFDKVQNKGGQKNKPIKVEKKYVQFL